MRARLLVPLLALVMTQAACSDKDDKLTREESAQLFAQVSTAALQALAGAQASPSAAPQATPTTYSGEFSGTHECAIGGTIGASGNFDGQYEYINEVYNGSFSYNLILGFTDCAVQAGDITVTLNGQPNLVYTGDWTTVGDTYEYNFSEAGAVGFETSDGRSGTCDVEYTYSATYDGTNSTVDYTANVCGNSFTLHATS